MPKRRSNKSMKAIRRTYEPTRIAQAMLEHAYQCLIPQTVRVIESQTDKLSAKKSKTKAHSQ